MMAEHHWSLPEGWRQSMRTSAFYRRRGGWIAIITPGRDTYDLVLRRSEPSLEDALAAANEIIVPLKEES